MAGALSETFRVPCSVGCRTAGMPNDYTCENYNPLKSKYGGDSRHYPIYGKVCVLFSFGRLRSNWICGEDCRA
jgi:hypothetical protein